MEVTTSFVQRFRTPLIWTSVATGVVVFIALTVGGTYVAFGQIYGDRILPQVHILGTDVGGLTKQEAKSVVEHAVDTALKSGLTFRYHGKDSRVAVVSDSTNPDVSHDLIQYDIPMAIDAAYGIGRSRGVVWNAMERIRVFPLNVFVKTTIDTEGLREAISDAFQAEVQAPQDAHITITPTGDTVAVAVEPEKIGAELLLNEAVETVADQASEIAFEPIELRDRVVTPKVAAADLQSMIPQVETYLQRPALSFTYENQTFAISRETLASWVSVTGTSDGRIVILGPEAFAKGLHDIAKPFEREKQNGSLMITDEKVQSFVAGVDGITVDTDLMYATVMQGWPASTTFALVMKTLPATLIGEDPERLGIKELLGTGTSNFSGSPTNRRKNIARGAQLVNGTVIQPGETFSLITTLGPIDGDHEWLSELVIKGNETKPEFGGGLCQIGTTTFRAALNSGLPIVERRNHSYRVRYYEPAGTDATIYDPKPDFRFLNDTAHPIYINAYLKGDDAFFEFWGTRDGRVATVAAPRIFNIVPPPPTKIIETLDLPVGVKKCTESAHAGADAELDYAVTYADGTVKETTFESHYRPWQAVCQLGVAQLSATSTQL